MMSSLNLKKLFAPVCSALQNSMHIMLAYIENYVQGIAPGSTNHRLLDTWSPFAECIWIDTFPYLGSKRRALSPPK